MLASREELPTEVRRGALTAFATTHERALATLRTCAFTAAEARAVVGEPSPDAAPRPTESIARTKP